jgi:hypothetical protein
MTRAMTDTTEPLGRTQRNLSAVHIVHQPASASRPYGRYAVALRASLDTDASSARTPRVGEEEKPVGSTTCPAPLLQG